MIVRSNRAPSGFVTFSCSGVFRGVLRASLLASVLGLLSNGVASAQTNSWTSVAPDPIPRGSPFGGVINGKLYVSGMDPSRSMKLDVYDPATNTWSLLTPSTLIRAYAGAGVINGKLYVVGGCSSNADCRVGVTSALEVYDPISNTWSTLAAMPTARYGVAVGVINGKLYVTAGTLACPPCNQPTATEVYDPTTNTWSTAAPIPTPRESATATVFDGSQLFYVVGGGQPAGIPILGTVEVYNSVTNTWSSRTSMLTFRAGAGAGVINALLYVVGGFSSVVLTSNESYDPERDYWTERAPVLTARARPLVAVINSKLYAVDGTLPDSTNTGANEMYTGGQAPGAPVNFVATANGNVVTLTWNAPTSGDPVVTYIIEAGSVSGAANLANFSTGSPATSYSASGVVASTYYMRVRAKNAAGTSAPSNEAILVVGGAACTSAPNAPSGLTSTVSGSTVTLSWNAPSGGCAVTSYVLQAGSLPGLSNLANANIGTTATSFVAIGVGNGVYYVRVVAVNTFGQSAPSNEVIVTVGSTTTGGSLTGTWIGLSPDGFVWDPSTGNCDLEHDIQLTLTQTGATLTGSLYDSVRKAARSACSSKVGVVTGPWTVTGTAGAGTLTLSVTMGQPLVLSGTFTNTRMALSGAAGLATLTLNRQ